ncbi:hypothetical protein HF209_30590 [Pseudomonas sp. WS 5096]|uniref:Uncharacterized protein n=1 Tax=Pseudomonas cremoris TaxID=2724178 RepID=A0ABR6TH65_9PSED|nr:hypothetical protein [Pseudomonas cremoris]MBC2385306.1 hypothetical protein [Pseudomonas cremoris]
MESANVYKFPGKRPGVANPAVKAAPPVMPVPVKAEARAKPAAKSAVKPGAKVFHAFLMIVVIFHRPLGWMFGAVFGWYFLRWMFLSGMASTFAGFVALASFIGIVALKYLVMSWKDESSSNVRPTKKAK